MNKLLVLVLLMSSSLAHAADPVCSEQVGSEEVTGQLEINTNVPKHLRGATIIVRQADGRESRVPAERFKVVPRKQQFLTTRTERNKVLSCTLTQGANRKNRVSAVGGYGATGGLSGISMNAAGQAEVESKVGLVGGLQYQRVLPLLDDRLSLGVQGQTSKTGSLLLGVDF